MTKRVLYDHRGSVLKELITHDHDEDEFVTVRTAQDLEPVLELVKKMRDMNQVVGHRKSRQMVPIAEVPLIVYERAMREGWADDEGAWKKFLNDPQNRPFRVTDGRV